MEIVALIKASPLAASRALVTDGEFLWLCKANHHEHEQDH